MSRTGERQRKTKETEIRVYVDLDGTGESNVRTGIGFFDHMLDALARHGMFDLDVECTGDLHIDAHHTVEDVGIALGGAFLDALGDKRGIVRYADATVPLDEALVRAVVDVSGRPFLHFDVPLPAGQPMIGQFDAALSAEFWRGFAMESRITLHLDGLRGDNAHHIVEATFKAAARALDAATAPDPRRADQVPSTKGSL
ncbi:imidazoleglycerol-phosphate dehydratase HisB [Longimicrobium terrae]|uniref:Imidazoleglycerol-phosphate dehydratase n=1 Tax=Longimicrobium terrae TaxID=1639882 RepID=A0A841H1H8_9BACT|nr:imidazoleglycerol-phosphate dehydratase HisB [Longimicrobium terrae]MBB4637462.1 imidazoleglycerol-phosphate dehydratase [Longimicrobium terrae]MBB6071860.1 imidazoleglycerol-phosphate dehydratase [Longimicrobium terrae]NNC30409.1 imidazoleglycerol-phosphate dehydratase HisB [Longimicrobium terrae]